MKKNTLSEIFYPKNPRFKQIFRVMRISTFLLLGLTVPEVQADREGAAVSLAEKYHCVAVLKGHHTLVAAPDGTVWRNETGNAGLAKGGSGDILAGLISSFSAQGLPAFDSAVLGVFIHNLSGRLAAEQYSDYCLLPDDIIKYIHKAFNKITCERKA